MVAMVETTTVSVEQGVKMSRQPSLGANSKAPVVAIALCFCSNPLQRLGSLATLALSRVISSAI